MIRAGWSDKKVGRTLFNHENEGLVVVGVEVGVLHRRLLLLSNPLAFSVEKFDLHIRICKRKKKKCFLLAKREAASQLAFTQIKLPQTSHRDFPLAVTVCIHLYVRILGLFHF